MDKRVWYTSSKKGDLQGLVIEEGTGANIAVTYKVEDAPVVAAAPELLEIVKTLANDDATQHATDLDHFMFYARLKEKARAAIKKVEEDD